MAQSKSGDSTVPKKTRIPKWLRIVLWIGMVICLLLLTAWGFFYYYVYQNKQPLIKKINTEVTNQIGGEFSIKDLDLVFWKDFPSVSLRLKEVALVDSLYAQHKHALFESKEIYLKVDLFSLLSRKPEINKISLSNASFHLFTNAAGYSNKYVLSPKTKRKIEKQERKKDVYLQLISLENVHLLIEDVIKEKHIEAHINKLDAVVENTDSSMHIKAPIDADIGQLGFNLEKGAFLIDQHLKADLKIIYLRDSRQLTLPLQPVNVSGEDLRLGLIFRFGDKPANFELEVADDAILMKKGVSFLNAHIAKNFKHLDLRDPLAVHVSVKGKLVPKDKPLARVDWSTTNNRLVTQYGNIDSATFSGYFFNNYEEGKGYVDSNSVIAVPKITGVFNGNIPFSGDSIQVHGFKDPHLTAHVQSDFAVSALNDLLGRSFLFSGGKADMDLSFKGHLSVKNKSRRSLLGYIRIADTKLDYLPRGLKFRNVNINLEFQGEDILLKEIKMTSGRSGLSVGGVAKNFMNAYFDNPELVILNWQVESELIDVNDFTSFLIPRRQKIESTSVRKAKLQALNDRIENILDKGNMMLRLHVKQVEMNSFVAHNLFADIDLLSEQMLLNNIKVDHAGGHLELTGTINQTVNNNPFTLKGKLAGLNIDEFFYGMRNFGMKTLTADNLSGTFYADINIKGNFTDRAELMPRSLEGKVNFKLEEGAIVHFKPFMQIKKYVFKKRNLDSIRFKDISNDLVIKDGRVTISPMAIESSALNMYVKGIYSFHRGTDLSIEIPLRNPDKDIKRVAKGLEKQSKRGLKVYLRAQDDEDGNVSIKWDPFKKGADAVDEKLHLNKAGELIEEDITDEGKGIQEPDTSNQESRTLEEILQGEKKPEKKKNILQRIRSVFVKEKEE